MRSSRPASRAHASRAARASLAAGSALAALTLAACGDPSEPPQPDPTTVRLRIVAGEERPEDTIYTRRTLVVEARDARGIPVPGIEVHALAGHMLVDGEARDGVAPVFFVVPAGASTEWQVGTTQRTDPAGRVVFPIQLGHRAGEGSVVVSTQSPWNGTIVRGDTMRVTVRPGAPAALRFASPDTVVMRGQALSLGAAVRDRGGNAVPGAVTLALPADTLVDVGGGRLRAERTGRVRVVASHGAWRDTVNVSIVPAGTLTAVVLAERTGDPIRLVTLRTDGTDARELARVVTTLAGGERTWAPSWVPAADRIVTPRATGEPRLETYALDGTVRPLITGDTRPARGEAMPRWTYDASWIWFSGATEAGGSELWRVRADGSGAARVGPTSAGELQNDWHPAPSPDGRQVAFVTTREHPPMNSMAVLDVATGAYRFFPPSEWGGPCGGPAWSPDGAWILWQDCGRNLHIVRPDGTGDRVVSTWADHATSYAWSPDSRWIVGHDGIALRVLEVATGLQVRIPGTAAMRRVDWGR